MEQNFELLKDSSCQDSTPSSSQSNHGRTASGSKNVKDVIIATGDIKKCDDANNINVSGISAIENEAKEFVHLKHIRLDRNPSIKRSVQFIEEPSEVISNGAIPQTVLGELVNDNLPPNSHSFAKSRGSITTGSSQCENCLTEEDGYVDEDEDDESSLEEQFSDSQPPDGGWGWVVVAAAFVTNMIADGVTFTFGIIYVDLLRYFGEGKSKTAWIGGLFMSMPLISGPVASYLTDRFGCRRVCMFGSLLSTLGFVISSFADSIELLIFTFGILSGFGLALCYVTAVVIVAYYFDKRRSLATGLSVCGSGIGTFLFAPLTTYLVTEYGWRGTTLILAGLFFNICVCGALMRDLEWTKAKSKALRADRKLKNLNRRKQKSYIQSLKTATSSDGSCNQKQDQQDLLNLDELRRLLQTPGCTVTDKREDKDANSTKKNGDPNRLYSSVLNLPTFVHNGEKVPIEVLELLSSNQDLYNVVMQNYPTLLTTSRSMSDSGKLHENKHVVTHHNHVTHPPAVVVIPHPSICRQSSLNYHDKAEREFAKNVSSEEAYLWWLKKYQYQQNAHHRPSSRRSSSVHTRDLKHHRLSLTYRGAMLNLKRNRLRASSCPNICRDPLNSASNIKDKWFAGFYDLWDLLVDMVDVSHFTDIRFVLFAISNFLLYSWYHVPYTFLPDKAGEMGFTEDESSGIISYLGIFNTVGEVILGWAGDQPKLNAGMIYALCMAMCGVMTAIMPLLSDYTGLCIVTGGFGLSIAANYSMASIILVELITLERFTNAYGLLLLVQGLANLVGPPLAGWLYDTTGNYDLSFYLAGFFIILCGALLLVLPAMKWTRRWRETGTRVFGTNGVQKQNNVICIDNIDSKPITLLTSQCKEDNPI